MPVEKLLIAAHLYTSGSEGLYLNLCMYALCTKGISHAAEVVSFGSGPRDHRAFAKRYSERWQLGRTKDFHESRIEKEVASSLP